MIKLAIPAIVGLLLGLGASTGAVIYLNGGASLGEDLETAMVDENGDAIHAEADSAHAGDHAEPDSMHAGDSYSAAGHVEGVDAAAAGLVAGGMAATEGHVDPAAQALSALTAATQPPPQRGMTTTQLAELYGTMSPREAAKVLEHMENEEVQIILAGLDNRKAAAILSNLSPERAAVVSRSVLSGERSTQ